MNKALLQLIMLALPVAVTVAAGPDQQSAHVPDDLVVDGRVVGQQVEVRPGEICLVCKEPVLSSDVVYLVRGQRVAVHREECTQDLLARLQYWLAQIQPRVALFSVDQGRGSLSSFWLFACLYVVVGLIFAGATAHLAVRKALPPVPWFFAGLFLSAVGYLVLLTRSAGDASAFPTGIPGGLRKVPLTCQPVVCPNCGATLHPAARGCSRCGAKVTPSFESEAWRWRKQRIG